MSELEHVERYLNYRATLCVGMQFCESVRFRFDLSHLFAPPVFADESAPTKKSCFNYRADADVLISTADPESA